MNDWIHRNRRKTHLNWRKLIWTLYIVAFHPPFCVWGSYTIKTAKCSVPVRCYAQARCLFAWHIHQILVRFAVKFSVTLRTVFCNEASTPARTQITSHYDESRYNEDQNKIRNENSVCTVSILWIDPLTIRRSLIYDDFIRLHCHTICIVLVEISTMTCDWYLPYFDIFQRSDIYWERIHSECFTGPSTERERRREAANCFRNPKLINRTL